MARGASPRAGRGTRAWLAVLVACACVCPRAAELGPAAAVGDGADSVRGLHELVAAASRHGDKGEYAEALRLFEAACAAARAHWGGQGRSWPPASLEPAMVVRHGIAAFKAGHTELALEHLKTACAEGAPHCLDLCTVLRTLGRYSEAIAVAEAAISRAPSSDQLWLAYGLALSSSSLYLRAFQAYRNAFRLNPDDAKLLINVGQSLVHCGEKLKALEYFKSAHRRLPNDVKVLLVL